VWEAISFFSFICVDHAPLLELSTLTGLWLSLAPLLPLATGTTGINPTVITALLAVDSVVLRVLCKRHCNNRYHRRAPTCRINSVRPVCAYVFSQIAIVWFGDCILMSDYCGHCIYRVNVKTAVVDLYAGAEDQPGFRDSSKLEFARFDRPTQLTVDPVKEMVYVIDSRNLRIRALHPNGRVSTIAGTGNKGYEDGPGLHATFWYPRGISVLYCF
jgi:hypothetical protein